MWIRWIRHGAAGVRKMTCLGGVPGVLEKKMIFDDFMLIEMGLHSEFSGCSKICIDFQESSLWKFRSFSKVQFWGLEPMGIGNVTMVFGNYKWNCRAIAKLSQSLGSKDLEEITLNRPDHSKRLKACKSCYQTTMTLWPSRSQESEHFWFPWNIWEMCDMSSTSRLSYTELSSTKMWNSSSVRLLQAEPLAKSQI